MMALEDRDWKQIERTVRALCARWNCPAQDRDDVVQDTFLLLLQQDIPVARAAATALRRVCRGDKLEYVPSRYLDTLPGKVSGPDEEAERREGLEELDPEDKELLLWRRAGWTLPEIGHKLGMSPEAVSKRIRMAQETERQRMYP